MNYFSAIKHRKKKNTINFCLFQNRKFRLTLINIARRKTNSKCSPILCRVNILIVKNARGTPYEVWMAFARDVLSTIGGFDRNARNGSSTRDKNNRRSLLKSTRTTHVRFGNFSVHEISHESKPRTARATSRYY